MNTATLAFTKPVRYVVDGQVVFRYRPFLSYPLPSFQNESWCKEGDPNGRNGGKAPQILKDNDGNSPEILKHGMTES